VIRLAVQHSASYQTSCPGSFWLSYQLPYLLPAIRPAFQHPACYFTNFSTTCLLSNRLSWFNLPANNKTSCPAHCLLSTSFPAPFLLLDGCPGSTCRISVKLSSTLLAFRPAVRQLPCRQTGCPGPNCRQSEKLSCILAAFLTNSYQTDPVSHQPRMNSARY
jgi:hypothetical protein